MTKLPGLLQDYIDATSSGPETEPKLGRVSTERVAAPRPENVDATAVLIRRLDAQSTFNNRLIIVVVATYVAILAFICVLAVVQSEPAWLVTALGGNILILAGSVSFLRDVWREKNYIDMLLAILPSLTGAEAAKVVKTLYLEKLEKKRSPRTPSPAPEQP
jgi:hypothetical protein